MIQTGNVNDLKTGIGTGEAQVLEGFKVTPASNDAANNILANRRLESDKAEKKAKEQQKLYEGLNMDLKGTRTQDVAQIRSLMANARLKMQQSAAEGKLNINSPEFQQMTDAIADSINYSMDAKKADEHYVKEGSKDGFLSGKYEFTPQAKKDHEALSLDNTTPVGPENHSKWIEEVTGKTKALNASAVGQMVFDEVGIQKALASNATAYKNNHTNKLEIKDPNDPSQTIIIEKESYNPQREIEGIFDAPTPKGLAMQRFYTGMLSNNEALAKQYKFNPAPETKEQEVKNLEAAKQLAVDRNMQMGSVGVNKQELQGGDKGTKETSSSDGMGVTIGKTNLYYVPNSRTFADVETSLLDWYNKENPNYKKDNLEGLIGKNTYDKLSSKGVDLLTIGNVNPSDNTFLDLETGKKDKNGKIEIEKMKPIGIMQNPVNSSVFLLLADKEVKDRDGKVTGVEEVIIPFNKRNKGRVSAEYGNINYENKYKEFKDKGGERTSNISNGSETMQTKTSNTNVKTVGKKKKANASNYGL